jgi:hypothetical protein
MQTGADMDQIIDRVMSEDSRRFADRDGS